MKTAVLETQYKNNFKTVEAWFDHDSSLNTDENGSSPHIPQIAHLFILFY